MPLGPPTAVAGGAQAALLCLSRADMLPGACSAGVRDAISHMRLQVPGAVASVAERLATLIPQAQILVLLDAMVALSVRPGLVNGVEALLAVSSGADEELAGRGEALDELRAGSAARLGDVSLEAPCRAQGKPQ